MDLSEYSNGIDAPQVHRLRPPVKAHGGKYYLARQIVPILLEVRERITEYLEPCAFGASVFLAMPRMEREILGDNVWSIPRLVENSRERLPDFPTQFPLDLVRPIVLCASNPGDLVLDPFSGSGTTGTAAVLNGRRFVGIESNGDFALRSQQRLASLLAK